MATAKNTISKSKVFVYLLVLMVLINTFISSSSTAYAATFKAVISGGAKINGVATINNTKYSSVSHLLPLDTPAVVETNSASWTPWTEEKTPFMYKKFNKGNNTGGLVLRYNNLLKIGSNKYDVKVTVKSVNTSCNNVLVGIRRRTPYIGLNIKNFKKNGVELRDQTTSHRWGSTEVCLVVDIYKAGTNDKAVLPKLFFAMTDIDGESASNGRRVEAWTLPSYSPTKNNLFSNSLGGKNLYYKKSSSNTTIYGSRLTESDATFDQMDNAYAILPSLRNGSSTTLYYGGFSDPDVKREGNFGSGIEFYEQAHTVTYKSDSYGSIKGITTEDVCDYCNPEGTTEEPNDPHYYYTDTWKCDKDVTLNNGTTISANTPMTMDEIKQVAVSSNLEFTVYHKPYYMVIYSWKDKKAPPNVDPPLISSEIKGGTLYTVDTTFKRGDTVPQTGPGETGVWEFRGWDTVGTIVINETTHIVGTWVFTKNLRVDYQWEGAHPNKNVPDSVTDIPPNTRYTTDTTYYKGRKVSGSYQGVDGTWTFQGWQAEKTFLVKKDTTVLGAWTFNDNVNVNYEWKGDAPDEDPPKGENNISAGTKHTVDKNNLYPVGKEVEGEKDGEKGYWTFDHWEVNNETVEAGTKLTINEDTTIQGVWNFTPYVNVTYKWKGEEGDYPNVKPPEGTQDIRKGTEYTPEKWFDPDEITEPKGGKTGYWTFLGWDKTEPFNIEEDTTIYGEWSFTPNVNVTYKWKGGANDHPNVKPPAGELDIRKGSTHVVDTSYIGKEIEAPREGKNGFWSFDGWDETRESITVNQDTVIEGSWTFIPNVRVSYEWTGEVYPEDIDPPGNMEDIKKGAEYTPEQGFEPSEVEGEYDGKEGLFTFEEWDKTEPFNVNEDTTIYGTWNFTEYVKATYKWKNDLAPESAELPNNENRILKGDYYTVSDKYTSPDEREIVEPYQGKNGYWTFMGWNPTGTLQMNEDKEIEGTWRFTSNVNVTYVWEGGHPTIDPPEGELDIRKGSKHIVDKSFIGKEIIEPKGDKNGYWRFDGWDEKEDVITVNEDTVITGTWTFVPNVSVKYEWKDDKHPEAAPPKGVSDIRSGTEYTPQKGYTPSEIEGTYQNKEGLFTFKSWDKTEPFNVNEDTIIYGTWDFTEYVKATYKWKDNKAPESAVLPKNEDKILKGDSYTVSDKYTSPDEKEIVEPYQGKNGYWTFMGWNPNGTLEMNESKEIEGTWEFTPNVSVKYEWADDDHPTVDPPKGEPDIRKGSTHIVDTSFIGKEVIEPKEGKNGYWKFNGWDEKRETIIVDENTVIHGTWTFVPNVSVTYEWEGDHPTIDPPKGEPDIRKGSEHIVNTSFIGKEIIEPKEDKNGYWKFDGWDEKREAIIVDENTVIHGTWTFVPNVSVTYEWEGDHPTIDPPKGEPDIRKDSIHVVDTSFIGKEVIEPKEGKNGYWKFNGWDEIRETIIVDKDTIIHGAWTFVPNVSVTYEWEGDVHPSVNPPEGEIDIRKGSVHIVDTTFKKDDTIREPKDEQDGYYRFSGWDIDEEEIPINEDTVIKGTWTFHPLYKITTEVVNGTITGNIPDIEEGESKTVNYLPNAGYQLQALEVDAQDQSIKTYPTGYAFNNIKEDHHVKAVFELIPELNVRKVADKNIVNAGDTITYTVTVSQTVEGAEARNIIITDTLPEKGVKLDPESFDLPEEAKDLKIENNRYTFRIASLSDSITYSYKATTDNTAENESIVNTVKATAENVPDPAEDEETVKTVIPKPEVEKFVDDGKTVKAEKGDTVHFKIVMRQARQDAVLRNAKLTDKIPEGLEIDEDSISISDETATYDLTDNILTVEKAELTEEVVIEFDAEITDIRGKIKNIAILTGDNVDPVEDTVEIEIPPTVLSIKKTVNKKKAVKGNTVKYNIVVTQSGAKAINAVVTDRLPSEIKIDKDSITCSKDADISVSNGVLKVKLGETFEGKATITFKAKVTKTAGKIKNVAKVTADNSDNDKESYAIFKVKKKPHREPQTGDKVLYGMFGITSLIAMIFAAFAAKKRLFSK